LILPQKYQNERKSSSGLKKIGEYTSAPSLFVGELQALLEKIRILPPMDAPILACSVALKRDGAPSAYPDGMCNSYPNPNAATPRTGSCWRERFHALPHWAPAMKR